MLKCKVIAGCANNVLEEERHGFELRDRGILYAPDYVINAGGIINVSVEFHPGGYDEVEAMRRINRIGESLRQVYAIAREGNIPTAEAADLLAERRLEAGRKSVS
ncbi:MAG TPA: leucine dehydrogenase, partial [Planctomycetota bacterium]|nr:leucine dehydrogenase [Planctomycetota bacterium]